MSESIEISNRSKSEIRVILEPWGDIQALPAGESISVRSTGDPPGRLEVEYGDAQIVVYGWTGSDLELERVDE